MASLQETKRRINSVESTLKITSAMKLVATAKLRTARLNYEETLEYASSVGKIIQALSQSLEAEFYTQKRSTGKDLYIMIGSEIGLCGGYNTNMFKLVENHTDAMFITLGKKANSYFSHRKQFHVIESIAGITDYPNLKNTAKISNQVFEMYNNMEIKSINVVYTKYINSVSFEPTIMQVLPLKQHEDPEIIDYEPSAQEIINSGIPRFVDAMLYLTMKESLVSEYASRRLAMENATDNATELIDTLEIQKNRARQAAITQEISEIVAGAEAI